MYTDTQIVADSACEFGEKTMNRTVFVLLVLALFVLAACGAPIVPQQETQPATDAQADVPGATSASVVTVYKTTT